MFYASNLSKDVQKKVVTDLDNVLSTKFSWYCKGRDGGISKGFEKKTTFYINVARGLISPRSEWIHELAVNQQDIKMFIAFGDRLINPECRKDYQNAPMIIIDLFEISDFRTMMIGQVKDYIVNYCNAFSKL